MRQISLKHRKAGLLLAALLAALALAAGATKSSGTSDAVSWTDRAPQGHASSVSWDS